MGDNRLRSAVVAIVIINRHVFSDHVTMLLAQRSNLMRKHIAQYIPWGKLKPGETYIAADLHELEEDFRLKPSRCLGELDDYSTRSQFSIRPLVLWANKQYLFDPHEGQVIKIFTISFSELVSNVMPHFESGVDETKPILFAHFLAVVKHVFYSFTTSILYQFREIVICGLSTRIGHYDQSCFAWK